jgi:hypothetical protein
MRINDFMGLTPPLRNFFRVELPSRPRSEAPEARERRRRLGRCVSGADEAQKQRKRKESFAKRNERFRDAGRKSLKSLGCEIGLFRQIVCFQWVNRLFVSRFLPHARE